MNILDNKWAELEALVVLAQSGDRDAFGELIERCRGRVTALVRARNRNAEEVADIVQDVFLHALRKLNQLRAPGCFMAWLQQIAVRLTINRAIRRPRVPTVDEQILRNVSAEATDPGDDLALTEERKRVRTAIHRLRPLDRDVLVAHYLRGKPLAGIADEFGVPLGTVKRRLHVARNRLEALLDRKVAATGSADAKRMRLNGEVRSKLVRSGARKVARAAVTSTTEVWPTTSDRPTNRPSAAMRSIRLFVTAE